MARAVTDEELEGGGAEPVAPKPKKPLWRRILKWFFVTVGILLLLVLLFVGFLHTGPGKSLVKGIVEDKLNERVNGKVTLGELDYALFGDLGIKELVFQDADGKQVLRLGALDVAPSWGDLLGGNIVVERLAVDGLDVDAAAYADGSTTFSRLFKEPMKLDGKKPLKLEDVDVKHVNVHFTRPDGTDLRVTDFHVRLAADVDKVNEKLDAAISELGFDLKLVKPGLSVAMPFSTGLDVHRAGRVADLTTKPITTTIHLERDGQPPQDIPLKIGSLALSTKASGIVVSVDGVEAGPLTIERLAAVAQLGPDGLPAGQQSVAITKLHIARDALNDLLGRSLLLSDVTVDVTAVGPPDAVAVAGNVATDGGNLSLTGTVDAHDPLEPRYDLVFVGAGIDTEKLLAGPGPAVTTEFKLAAKGKGIRPGAADADITFDLGPTVVNGKAIESVHAEVAARGPVIKLEELTVSAYGQTLVVDGEMNRETREVSGSMKTKAGLADAVAKAREAGVLIVPLPALGGSLDVDLHFAATLKPRPVAGAEAAPTEEPPPSGITVALEKLPIEKGRLWGHVTGEDIQADARKVGALSFVVDAALADQKPTGTVKLAASDVDTGTRHLDEVAVDLTLDGFEQDIVVKVRDEAQRLAVDAAAHTKLDLATRHVTATLKSLELARGGAHVELARPVTLEVDAPDPKGAEQTFTLPATTLKVAGGEVTLGGRARFVRDPEHPEAQRLADFGGNVDLDGLSLGALAALARRPTRGVSGRISGHLTADGTLDNPSVGFGATITARAPTAPSAATIRLSGGIIDKRLSLDAKVLGKGRDPVATLSVKAPLAMAPGKKPGLAPGGRLLVDMAVEPTTFGELAAILPAKVGEKLDPSGTIEANAHLAGSPARPTGRWRLAVAGKLAPEGSALHGKTQRVELGGSLTPDATGVALASAADVWIDASGDKLVGLTLDGHFERSPLLPTRLERPWHLGGRLAEIDLAKARLPTPNAPRAGRVWASFEAGGAGPDVTGNVHLEANGVDAGPGKPVTDVRYDLTLGEAALTIDAAVKAGGLDAVALGGTVGVGGKGIRRTVKDKAKLMAAPLALTFTVPKHPVAAWSKLGPKPLTIPGDFGGSFAVSGTLGAPEARGALAYDNFRTAAGTPGRVALELDATPAEIAGGLAIGAPGADGKAPMAVRVHVDPAQLKAYQAKEGGLDVRVDGGADAVALLELVPAYALGERAPEVRGVIDASFATLLHLNPGEKKPDPAKSTVDARLALRDVALTVPGTTRAFHDVGMSLVATNAGIDLGLTAREDDMQKKDRALDVTAKVGLDQLVPTGADVHVVTREFLVMGKGFDGPEGELTATIDVAARELMGPVRDVTITIPALELNSPDRFPRAHYQQMLSYYGDVVFLEDGAAGSGRLGGNPVVGAVAEPSKTLEDADGTPKPAPAPLALDLHLRIPNRIHALAHPLDLYVQGAMDVAVRGKDVQLDGKLDVVDGAISVMGWWWPLVQGAITAKGGLDTALVDLTFRKRPKDAALRDIAVEDRPHGGDTFLNVQLSAAKGQVLSFFGAAGNWLLDTATVLNTGRSRIWSRADLPAAVNAQFGDPNQGLTNTFVQTNLENLVFMDRANGWSEPIGAWDQYGRIWNFRSERVVPGSASRVRFEMHDPYGVATNRAELHYDLLFEDAERSVIGAGAAFGTDLRLGLGLFFELYSSD